MKLICVHCARFHAAPLSSVPRGWVDIVPDPESRLPPVTYTAYETECGTIADTFGICPQCEEYRKTAFVAEPYSPDENAAPPAGTLF